MRVIPRARFPNDGDIEHNTIADPGGGMSSQLLKRMEELRLEAAEVRRIESDVFNDLVGCCASCVNKQTCEQGLADAPLEAVTRDWEFFCPNAATLSALTALPWFGKAENGSGASSWHRRHEAA